MWGFRGWIPFGQETQPNLKHYGSMDLAASKCGNALRFRQRLKLVRPGEPCPSANKPTGLFSALIQTPQIANPTPFVARGYARVPLCCALSAVNQESASIAHFGRALRLSGLWRSFG